MAEAYKVTPKPVSDTFELVLDEDEAGYLLELLYAHVGGGLLNTGEPLGRIMTALAHAGVPDRTIRNLNKEAPQSERKGHSAIFAANDPDADASRWWDVEEPLADWEKDALRYGPHNDYDVKEVY